MAANTVIACERRGMSLQLQSLEMLEKAFQKLRYLAFEDGMVTVQVDKVGMG